LIPHKSQSRVREVLELIHMDICGAFSFYHFLGQSISKDLGAFSKEKL
jgi:hypothetical protein